MLIHLTLPVSNLAGATQFYDAVMATLEVGRSVASAHAVGYTERTSPSPFLWLVPNNARSGAVSTRLALRAENAQAVRQFHAAAMAAGGVSIASPGLVPQHGAQAFACTVHDLDGHQIEVIAAQGVEDEGAKKSKRPLNDWPDGEAPDYPDSDWSA